MSLKEDRENNFIEPDAKTLTYDRYLKIDELLSLQQELSDPKEHDETLFIIIHQVYELWFKQILHEVDRCQSFFDLDQIQPALRALKRIDSIQKVLIGQVNVLETMAPDEFNRFRKHLNPASGFQSHQFRVLEFRLGLKNKNYFRYYKGEEKILNKLQAALDKPSLYDGFLSFLVRRGFNFEAPAVSDFQRPCDERITEVFSNIYRENLKEYAVYAALESLMDLDEQFTIWRYRHMLMVERMIGNMQGTGGSMGAKYLATTLEKRLFPEIWALRNHLGKLS